MTIREALIRGSDAFREAGLETPYLDAMVLLSACTGRDKAALYAAFTDPLAEEAETAFAGAVRRRLEGLPVSYILRRKEFYGLSFYVDGRVLVPRPDTETLVETALEILRADPDVVRIHDACTGTGCVPIAIAANVQENRNLDISASDISEEALEVFRINSRSLLGRELASLRSDLLESVEGPVDMITANPPYLSRRETSAMKDSGWPEPALALDGGEEGWETIERLVKSAVETLRENGYLLVEGTDNQADIIRQILEKCGYWDLRTICDLAGHRRVSVGRRGPPYA